MDMEGTVNGVTKLWRYVPPTHYTLRIDSFSLLLSSEIDSYQTSMFESGGYKWKLSLYPNGNLKRNVKDHISLYLAVANADALPRDWEVNVTFKFFLYNHMNHKYLTFQTAEEVTTRFYMLNNEVGFHELLPLTTLKDPSKGFLLGDCCIFGAEVFVTKSIGCGECISMIKDPPNNTFTWKIPNFSQKSEEYIFSDNFVVEDHKWKLKLYPKGNTKGLVSDVKGESISLYLVLVNDVSSEREVFAEFVLRVKDGSIPEKEAKIWFSSSTRDWGFSNFLSLKDFSTKSKPYLVNGTLTIEAQIMVVSKHKKF